MSERDSTWFRFSIGDSPYAIPLEAVDEVTAVATPRLIPLVSIHLGGIVNVRGEPLAVLDGGVLLRHQSASAYHQILVLRGEAARIGLLVSQLEGVIRGPFTLLEDDPGEDSYVSWATADGEKIGLVEPDGLLDRATELLTGHRSKMGDEKCPNAF